MPVRSPLPTWFRACSVGCLLTAALATSAFGAAPPVPAAPAEANLQIPFEKYLLNNGLEVILHQDRSLPLVAVNLWYHVGPANEPPGRSGFAHLFEHLMFKGSRHVGRDFDKLLEAAGATNVNGTTFWDRTNYFETVPREHLELALWIESDRMGYMLDGLDQATLDAERDVVKNERRQSFENSPYGKSSLVLLNTLFPQGTAYHGAVIGSMEDLSRASLSDVREFFHTYYAPGNATLTLAGDFDVAQAKAWITKYFSTLAARPRPASTAQPISAVTRSEHLTVKEPVELTRVSFGHVTPPAYSSDDPVLEVTAAILAGGKATRLYRALVLEGKLASEVDAAVDSNQLASNFTLTATVASGKSATQVERAMQTVLDQLAERGPTAAELDRARRRILLNVLGNLELLNGSGGEAGRAGILQRFNHYLKDPGYLPKWVEQIRAVKGEDVSRVIRAHLSSEHRIVVTTLPEVTP
ncbi:MAG TPA: pitrilysin family protein [Polyangiaceae bacterium]|nr:pitrilysin family protein [Polyangiaceae bacterium]